MYLDCTQNRNSAILYLNYDRNIKITIKLNTTYLVVIQWSRRMNLIRLVAYEYTHNENIPMYKLSNAHYYFDVDNVTADYVSKYNPNFSQDRKESIEIFGFDGWVTNIKVYDMYVDNVSELIQMYPTNQHLVVNDTARKLVGNQGVTLR